MNDRKKVLTISVISLALFVMFMLTPIFISRLSGNLVYTNNGLSLKSKNAGADYTNVNDLRAKLESLDSNKYTNYEIVIDAIKKIKYGKKISEQEEVDKMYDDLKEAYDLLEATSADYRKLNKAIEKYNKCKVNKDNYIDFIGMDDVIENINYRLTWEDQGVVDELTDKINTYIDNLVMKKADYSKLSDVLSKIPNNYKQDNTLIKYMKKVKKISNNETVDKQDKIDKLVQEGQSLILSNEYLNIENSENMILSYITINGNKLNLNDLKYNVSYNDSNIDIKIGVPSKDYSYEIYGGSVILPGNNIITIIVHDKNNNIYKYNVNVYRNITSNYLSELIIEESKIDFNKEKQEYNVKVGKNVNELHIWYSLEDDASKLYATGNSNLKNGSKVTLVIEDTEGSKRTYTLNIQKDNMNGVGITIILVMFLAVLAAIYRFIEEMKKHK